MAQTASGSESDDEASGTTSLTEIDIRGKVRREELKTTSAGVLTNNDVKDRVITQTLDLIALTPGVSVAEFGERGSSPSIQMRGFTNRNDTSMYLDGIPLHDNGHGAGMTDSTVVMPIEIETMEVIKGPVSVYYGPRSAGGVIAVDSIKRGNLNRLNVRYGSWNDINVTGLIARETGPLAQVYAFEAFHSDGWRDKSEWDRKILSGRWTYDVSDSLQVSLNLRAYQAEWGAAGYVSKFLNSPKDAVNDGSGEKDGGKRERYDARLWANYLIDKESQLTFYLYGTTLEFDYYMSRTRTVGEAAFPNMSYWHNRHNQWGTGLTYSRQGQVAGRDSNLAVGLAYSREIDDPRQQYSIPWGQGRTHDASNMTSNLNYDIANPAVFAEFSMQVLDYLNIRLGGRYDWLKGVYDNHMAAARSHSEVEYSFFSPKIGVLVTPLDNLEIFANFSRGFSLPSGYTSNTSTTGFFNSESQPRLMKRDQYELGARYAPLDWLSLELALFNLKTYDEFTTPLPGVTEQTGETTRRGVELAFDAVFAPDWRLRGHYSYTDAFYDRYDTATINYQGRRLTRVPRHLGFVELSYEPKTGLAGRVSVRVERDMMQTDEPPFLKSGAPNVTAAGNPRTGFRNQNLAMVDLQLSYRFNEHHRLVLDVTNVMGKTYETTYYSSTNYDTRDYTTGYRNPRAVYLTYQLNYDGK
jgi:outer membrane receptor protein involved in Fe transport